MPRAGVEPARPCGHYALNVARLPFRHLGNLLPMVNDTKSGAPAQRRKCATRSNYGYDVAEGRRGSDALIHPQNVQRVTVDDPFDLVLRYTRQMMILRELVQPP